VNVRLTHQIHWRSRRPEASTVRQECRHLRAYHEVGHGRLTESRRAERFPGRHSSSQVRARPSLGRSQRATGNQGGSSLVTVGIVCAVTATVTALARKQGAASVIASQRRR
jgi:hypothetical protein